jgi:hypothetical protein
MKYNDAERLFGDVWRLLYHSEGRRYRLKHEPNLVQPHMETTEPTLFIRLRDQKRAVAYVRLAKSMVCSDRSVVVCTGLFGGLRISKPDEVKWAVRLIHLALKFEEESVTHRDMMRMNADLQRFWVRHLYRQTWDRMHEIDLNRQQLEQS